MQVDLGLVVTCMAQQGFPVGVFLVVSKEFRDDPRILGIIKDKTECDWSRTRLMHATLTGNVERVKFLVSVGANVNLAQKPDNITPLMLASASGHLEMATVLVAAGADVNACTVFGRSPLSFLCISGEYRKILFGFGQPIQNYRQQPQIVPLLINAGADMEIPMWNAHIYAWTPLVWASSNGATEIVAALLQHGAKDVHGEAYREANKFRHIPIIKLLRSSFPGAYE
jgi:ankyrin repeat protein